MTNRSKVPLLQWLTAPAIALCLLAGVAMDRAINRGAPADPGPYHRRILELKEEAPLRIGMWFGTDVPVPMSAITLLRPNIILSRSFRELETSPGLGGGQPITFLLVHCADARDLYGHFPPICYPNQGWSMAGMEKKTWTVDDLVIQGMHYEFTSLRLDRPSRLIVDNFMILPNGTTCRDMEGVGLVAKDRRTRYFGAAQVQFVAYSEVSPEQREEFLQLAIRAHRPLIDAIRNGVNP